MRHIATALLAAFLASACNELPEDAPPERYRVTKVEGRNVDVDFLGPAGDVTGHTSLSVDPRVAGILKCGPTRACAEAAARLPGINAKPPGVEPGGGGGGGPVGGSGGGEGGGGGTISPGPIGGGYLTPEQECFIDFQDCMKDCRDSIPHLPPFAGVFLACVTKCSAIYAACLAFVSM